MDEGWLERAGVRLHWLEWRPDDQPREPALFLLHGLSSNARVWARMAGFLEGRRVVALDQRSHGASDRPETGYELDDLVADAAHAVRELGLGRPLVAGHSWGAAVALALTAQHPELASGLVFVDGPAASFSRFMTWDEAAQRMQPPLPAYADLDAAAMAERDVLGPAWGDDLRDFVRSGLVAAPAGGLVPTLTAGVRLQILRDLYAFQPELLFANVEGPILLAMAGQLWPGAPQEFVEQRRRSVDEVVELRPDAQVRWYDSRHDIPLIRPAELAAGVERTAIAAQFRTLAREAVALAAAPRHDWSHLVHGDPPHEIRTPGYPRRSQEGGAPRFRGDPGDGEGWDARDLLAHLSSTQAALPAVIAAPPVPPAENGDRPPFDSARWNASQLRRRRERRPDELADEMRRGSEQIHAALMAADLQAVTAAGSFAGIPLAEAMERMLDHQRTHLAELRAALGAS